ncbi:MAG: hypothetical protein QOJ95_3036 [Mycobacterium sp.]|nr:hypothetical protein [Mycobacterium sp.]
MVDSADAASVAVVLLDPTEPLFVWAVTVVLSSADVVVLVASDADEDEEVEEVEEVEEADDEAAVADAAEVVPPASDVELDGVVAEPDAESDELSDPAWPAELDEGDEAEEDDEDEESSARALATSGAASDAPNSAALTPADAAPTCNHRRTPKFSARRPDPLTDRPFECADIHLPLRQLFASKRYNEGVNIAATSLRNSEAQICGSVGPDLLHYRQYISTQTR